MRSLKERAGHGSARREAGWYALWLKRIGAHYELPLSQLESMPLGAFHREIATLLAEVIVSEARRLSAKMSDPKERRKRDAEYKKLTLSADWFDLLIVERIQQDNKR